MLHGKVRLYARDPDAVQRHKGIIRRAGRSSRMSVMIFQLILFIDFNIAVRDVKIRPCDGTKIFPACCASCARISLVPRVPSSPCVSSHNATFFPCKTSLAMVPPQASSISSGCAPLLIRQCALFSSNCWCQYKQEKWKMEAMKVVTSPSRTNRISCRDFPSSNEEGIEGRCTVL